ncbi:hypothetical protein KPL78_02190 [Roseomonas sp. HJA6]|uniref:DUF4347 domain-containing protein n=1 Tax=Roseomonas alba TaxID=2846776 RepID=A0ABS7A635_9PROT|nr:hypothetical protein [Neoroseomonas alba]MBW6396634.1 hypothetical protein [Neoroseomonas alba]
MAQLFIVDRRAPRAQWMLEFMTIRGYPVVDVHDIEDLASVSARAIARLRGERINRLTFVAHGYPGQLQLGQGLTEHSAHDLAPLRRHMRGGPLGSVWCFACMAGAGAGPDADHPDAVLHSGWNAAGSTASITLGPGYRLLRALAGTLDCQAHAPVQTQYLRPVHDYDRLLLGEAFQGPLLAVGPTGAFHLDYPDGSTRLW